ncbi:tetratricopeptide repeat protein [Puniceicoccaceae bacterium K14]|nr:tetratricopeptide repeat protein [Puniceicoccaceae bacterium K14]
MPQKRSHIPKRLIVLVILFIGIFVLSRFATNWESDEGKFDDYLAIAQNLPDIPEMQNWPTAYYDALKLAYLGVGELDGDYVGAYEKIGGLYLENGFLVESRVVFETLLAIDPENELWLYCKAKSFGERLSEERFRLLYELTSIATEYSKAQSMLVEALCLDGRLEEAHSFARRSLEKWPDVVSAKYDLVNVLLASGRALEAKQLIEASEGDPIFENRLFDAYGDFRSDSGGALESKSVARLSSVYREDRFEDYLSEFQYSYSDLVERVSSEIEMGLLERSSATLDRIKNLYPEDAVHLLGEM